MTVDYVKNTLGSWEKTISKNSKWDKLNVLNKDLLTKDL
jgi:hypothetical protein